jgi:uncharacterized protein YbaA (DUF1428 family)
MAPFLDEFVLPVPQDEIERYRNIAREARRIWRQGSALEYRERTAGNMRAKNGALFTQLAAAKPEEVLVFAWIVFESCAMATMPIASPRRPSLRRNRQSSDAVGYGMKVN